MKSYPHILTPLLVMVLITVLMGGTLYQQTEHWSKGVSKVIQELLEQAQSPIIHPDKDTTSPPFPDANVIENHLNFRMHLTQVDELKSLQVEAERVTRLVTLSMGILALLLAGFTVSDVDRRFRQMTQSQDLHIQLQEEERRRLAQELHDGAVQDMIALKRDYAPEKVDAVIEQLRRVCHNLKPQILDDLGLSAALHFLADDLKESGISQVEMRIDETAIQTLPITFSLPLFRVIQELCSNIKRHAKASAVTLVIEAYPSSRTEGVAVRLQDNGLGFSPTQALKKGGMGLSGVQERLRHLGSELHIDSKAGQGSTFQFVVPILESNRR